jgi:DNA-binding winged helix-turn-helix (wHTH) protein
MDLTAADPFPRAISTYAARSQIAFGEAVTRVEPKVMAVLVALSRVSRRNDVARKLFEEVWNGRAVTDDALTRCISALRRVFREGEGVEIKALPKLGYVLTAERAGTLRLLRGKGGRSCRRQRLRQPS